MTPIKKSFVETSISKATKIFSVLVVLSVLAVVYLSLSKTVITVVPRPQEQKVLKTISIVPQGLSTPEQNNVLEGRIFEKRIRGNKMFKNLTTVRTVEGKATGTVTIINRSSKAQPLVARTRLLSQEGVLFRTQETITVPAGGKKDVAAEADKEGEESNIGPSRFTIVALWKGLQEKIYGESMAPMKGGLKDIAVATQENIDAAKDELAKELKEEAIQKLRRDLLKENANWNILPQATTSVILNEQSNAEPNREKEEFEVKTELKLIAVLFDEEKLVDIMKNILEKNLPQDQELLSVNRQGLAYSVASFNLESQTAAIQATMQGTSIIKLSSPIFSRDRLTNRDRQEIQIYFSDFQQVESVNVAFSPFWTFRSPSLKDHIEIRIMKK